MGGAPDVTTQSPPATAGSPTVVTVVNSADNKPSGGSFARGLKLFLTVVGAITVIIVIAGVAAGCSKKKSSSTTVTGLSTTTDDSDSSTPSWKTTSSTSSSSNSDEKELHPVTIAPSDIGTKAETGFAKHILIDNQSPGLLTSLADRLVEAAPERKIKSGRMILGDDDESYEITSGVTPVGAVQDKVLATLDPRAKALYLEPETLLPGETKYSTNGQKLHVKAINASSSYLCALSDGKPREVVISLKDIVRGKSTGEETKVIRSFDRSGDEQPKILLPKLAKKRLTSLFESGKVGEWYNDARINISDLKLGRVKTVYQKTAFGRSAAFLGVSPFEGVPYSHVLLLALFHINRTEGNPLFIWHLTDENDVVELRDLIPALARLRILTPTRVWNHRIDYEPNVAAAAKELAKKLTDEVYPQQSFI